MLLVKRSLAFFHPPFGSARSIRRGDSWRAAGTTARGGHYMHMQYVRIKSSEPKFCQRSSTTFEFSSHVKKTLIRCNIEFTGKSLFEIAQLGGKGDRNLNPGEGGGESFSSGKQTKRRQGKPRRKTVVTQRASLPVFSQHPMFAPR